MTRLNFPDYKFRTKEDNGCLYIRDDLRKVWLVLTPEEWVRRNVIAWLVAERGVDAKRVAQEYPFKLGQKPFRADVVCFDETMCPSLLVECKAPEVTIDHSVLEQAVKYNSVIGAREIMLTNGLTHYFFERLDSGEYMQKQ